MLVNIGIDALMGAVPVLGVFGDALFKANMRNVALILRHARRRGSRPAGTIEVLD